MKIKPNNVKTRFSLKTAFFAVYLISVILAVDLEIGLRVRAGGADVRRFGADDDVTAVAAFPDLDLAFFKDGCGLDVL